MQPLRQPAETPLRPSRSTLPGTSRAPALAPFFTPRWTWRPVLLAAVVTLGIYLLLPALETRSTPSGTVTEVRPVTTVMMPPPPSSPAPPVPQRVADVTPHPPPLPVFQEERRRLNPPQMTLDLRLAVGDGGGDFRVNVGNVQEGFAEPPQWRVFDVGDLDEPPHPLARVQPIYPTQARMRRIEGAVVVAFVVNPDGTVRDIRILAAEPDDSFNPAVIRAVARWRFSPGKRGGEAVATRVLQRIEFNLN